MKKYTVKLSASMNVGVVADSIEEALDKAKSNSNFGEIDSSIISASILAEEDLQDLSILQQAKSLLLNMDLDDDINLPTVSIETYNGKEWGEEEHTIDVVLYDEDDDEIWMTFEDSTEHRLSELDETDQEDVCKAIVEYFTPDNHE